MAADLHTHRFKGGDFELVSTGCCEQFKYSSLEFHPWNLPDHFDKLDDSFVLKAEKCSAIGEIGLDRLRGPDLVTQRKYFDVLLETADTLSKPVVIHSVRCDAELFQALSGFKQNVLIHGFNGGVSKLAKYLESGFFVSFSRLQNREVITFLQKNGLRNIGLETDDLDCNIENIALDISFALDIHVDEVDANSTDTFKRFLTI